MLQLEKTFVRLGFYHMQLHREGDIALYKKVSVDLRTNQIESDPTVNFEVIKIQHQDADTITVDNVSFDVKEKEIYPKGYDWGGLGFSYTQYSEAKNHFNKLVKDTNQKLNVTLSKE